jgi:hypothetical protein
MLRIPQCLDSRLSDGGEVVSLTRQLQNVTSRLNKILYLQMTGMMRTFSTLVLFSNSQL